MTEYPAVIGRCYLRNRSTVNFPLLAGIVKELNTQVNQDFPQGFIAPSDETNISKEERVFYTVDNARRLDNYRRLIDAAPSDVHDRLLAVLLNKASVHANTSGVFKGFYKNRQTGIGQ